MARVVTRPSAKVLLTAFDPFAGQESNASQLAIEAVDPVHLPGLDLVRAILPCVFGEALTVLEHELTAQRPDVVICVGQAGGRPGITVERVAINVDDARIPDNAGVQPIDRPIAVEGPAAYFSTLPIKAIVAGLTAKGLPAAVSQTAGTFVCNHVFYGLMHALTRRAGVRGGFIHVPFLPEQVSPSLQGKLPPTMALTDIARALEIAVEVSVRVAEDIVASGGTTH